MTDHTLKLLPLLDRKIVEAEVMEWLDTWLNENSDLPKTVLRELGSVTISEAGLVGFENTALANQLEYGDASSREYQMLSRLRSHLSAVTRKCVSDFFG